MDYEVSSAIDNYVNNLRNHNESFESWLRVKPQIHEELMAIHTMYNMYFFYNQAKEGLKEPENIHRFIIENIVSGEREIEVVQPDKSIQVIKVLKQPARFIVSLNKKQEISYDYNLPYYPIESPCYMHNINLVNPQVYKNNFSLHMFKKFIVELSIG